MAPPPPSATTRAEELEEEIEIEAMSDVSGSDGGF